MSVTRPKSRLKFVPLGLLWGGVAGWFHIHSMLSPWDGYDEVNWVVPAGIVAGTCLIAIFLGSTMLKREFSSILWVVNWVVTGITSCVGGVAIFHIAFASLAATPGLPVADFVFVLALFSIGPIMEVTTGSTVVALLSAPLSLLGRRLILRLISAAEPAGGTSQTQP